MTFEDDIKPVHWQDMLAQMTGRKLVFAVRGGIALVATLALVVASAMAVFGYAAVMAVWRKGFAGMMEEGVLASFPLLDVKITLMDGGYHQFLR